MTKSGCIAHSDITGLVLAGGRGSRMGGIDKGLQNFRGMPLARHALLRLGGQVGRLVLNANRNLEVYADFGAPVWRDAIAGHAGPLAGFLAGLERCETPFLLTVPCDAPLFPLDLASRLGSALLVDDAEIAMAAAPEEGLVPGARPTLAAQPVFCLLRITLRDSLLQFIRQGGRRVGQWTGLHRTALVPFDRSGDPPHAFFNANTLADLKALQAQGAAAAGRLMT
jgi:molybdenum cofactor guanylyltransferase